MTRFYDLAILEENFNKKISIPVQRKNQRRNTLKIQKIGVIGCLIAINALLSGCNYSFTKEELVQAKITNVENALVVSISPNGNPRPTGVRSVVVWITIQAEDIKTKIPGSQFSSLVNPKIGDCVMVWANVDYTLWGFNKTVQSIIDRDVTSCY